MIYFKDGDKAKSVKELLTLGFVIETYGVYKFHKTYKDKEFSVSQCYVARRSFKDLLEIAKTYFPRTSKYQLAHLLVNDLKLFSFYCGTTNLVVFMKIKGRRGFHGIFPYDEDYEDGTGICYSKIEGYAKRYKACIKSKSKLKLATAS